MTVRGPALGVAGALLLVVSLALAITVGPADIRVADVWSVVAAHLGLGSSDLTPIRDGIVWQLRLPRTLLAAVCGAGLAVCGAVMQSLLRNPLADPFVLGVSSGASTGAVLVVVLGVGGGAVSVSAGAFLGALVSFALVLLLSHTLGGTTDRVVLAGVAAMQLFSALTSFIVMTAADAETTRGVLFWLLGSLGGAGLTDVWLCLAVLAVTRVVCLSYARTLDAFSFGQDAAAALGVSVARTRLVLLCVTAPAHGRAGQLGRGDRLRRAGPAARPRGPWTGPGHVRLLPVTALAGAVFLVWVDTLARTVLDPQEVPVGVVTSLSGCRRSWRCCTGHGGCGERGGDGGERCRAAGRAGRSPGRRAPRPRRRRPRAGDRPHRRRPRPQRLRQVHAAAAAGRVAHAPTAGVVTLDGTPLGDLPRRTVARRLAVVEQQADARVELTVADVVRLGRVPHRRAWTPASPDDERAVRGALERTGLGRPVPTSPGTPSPGGERQRVQIARALAQEPRELLLDEPTNHLDIHHQLDLLALVTGLPVTTVVALHDLNLAAMYCDQVVVLSAGRVVAGGAPGDVLTEKLIAEVYGVRAAVSCEGAERRPHVRFLGTLD
ncbi:Vitamin B12 import system permease protein BtuC [Streptomyces violarus]